MLPADNDHVLLAVAQAVEPLLAPTPPPPWHPPCTGCRLRVDTQPVTYSGTGPLEEEDTFSCYTYELVGKCELGGSVVAA